MARHEMYWYSRDLDHVDANPCTVGAYRQWRGRVIELESKRLKEIASRLMTQM